MVDYAIKEKTISGKSGRKVEIKKNISKQKERQSQLPTQLGKVHKKARFGDIKSND